MVQEDVGSTAFVLQLFVATTSCLLVMFYLVQRLVFNRCTFHPIFVQSITALVYIAAAFGFSDFMFVKMDYGTEDTNDDVYVALGRYMFWILTCPVIVHNFICLTLELAPSENISHDNTINFIVQDIAVMVFGVLAAFQRPGLMKGILIVLSVMVGINLVYSIAHLVKVQIARQNSNTCRHWLIACGVFFFMSWFIFPVLYMLSPVVGGVLSYQADIIGHTIGDLLAKDVFGFLIWYTRFHVIYPRQQKEDKNAEIVPDPGAVKEKEKENAEVSEQESNPTIDVLVVESSPFRQRLIGYLLKEVNVSPVFSFSLEDAKLSIARGNLVHFDAVLLDLQDMEAEQQIVTAFMDIYGNEPFFLPIIGFCLDQNPAEILASMGFDKPPIHGLIHHCLDQYHIRQVLAEWQDRAKYWRYKGQASINSASFSPTMGSFSRSGSRSSFCMEEPHTEGSYLEQPASPRRLNHRPSEMSVFNTGANQQFNASTSTGGRQRRYSSFCSPNGKRFDDNFAR